MSNCEKVEALVKEYANSVAGKLHWGSIVECTFDHERSQWHVIYESSPTLTAPYYQYEAWIDASLSKLLYVKRLRSL